jgi:hypothetical protein
MKATAALMCVGSLYAGAFWVAYQTALLLGVGYFLLAGGSALTLLAAALYRAPEGHERADGFHIRRRKRPSGFVPTVRPAQRPMRRGWT